MGFCYFNSIAIAAKQLLHLPNIRCGWKKAF
jgi:acetoin utilization deacetylase AcuC-like enzyme